jgi:hypothetical protein
MVTTSQCVERHQAALEDTSASLRSYRHRLPMLFGGVLAGIMLLAPPSALALTPDSPEVKEVIGKAVRYLEGPGVSGFGDFPGAKALVAMCVLKHYKDTGREDAGRNHPKVAEAVKSIQDTLQKGFAPQQLVYNTGICLIFLLELDRVQYHSEMVQLLALQQDNQRETGGYDYGGITVFHGDISVSQYGVLGMWACRMAEIPVPMENWERATNWLLRVQDPGGGYGYKATDPGNSTRVIQPEVRQSLSAAGLGSLCICAASILAPPEEKPKETGPPQLTRVQKLVPPSQERSTNISMAPVNEALALGKSYFSKQYNSDYVMDPPSWTHYYMYAMERYKSFLAELYPKEKADNKWYDDGYAMLAKSQNADGSFRTLGDPVINTAFGVLFLMRSTEKIIQHAKTFGGGLLVGGKGLPENSADLLVAPGGIRTKPLKGPAMDLLAKLAPDDPHMEEILAGLEGQSLVQEGDRLNEVQKRLHALMAQAKTTEAKAAALELIGRTRNLDEAPLLIEALKDPNPVVLDAAVNALRFLARKFGNAGYYGADKNGRKQAIQRWKAWYRDIRPNAVFADD